MKSWGGAAALWLAVSGAVLAAAGCGNGPSAPPAPSFLEEDECVETEPGSGIALVREGLLANAKYYACDWPKTDGTPGFSDMTFDDAVVTGVPSPVEAFYDGLTTLKGRTVLVSSDTGGFFAVPVADDAESFKGDLYWNEDLKTGNQTVRFAILAAESSLATPTVGGTLSKTVYIMKVGTGEVQINLRWHVFTDLDLHVFEPGDHEISWADANSPSGGQLDLDSYGQCGMGKGKGNENIFWPDGAAPSGTYRVEVQMYGLCGATLPVQYRVTVLQDRSHVTVYDRQYPEPPEGYEPIVFTR